MLWTAAADSSSWGDASTIAPSTAASASLAAGPTCGHPMILTCRTSMCFSRREAAKGGAWPDSSQTCTQKLWG